MKLLILLINCNFFFQKVARFTEASVRNLQISVTNYRPHTTEKNTRNMTCVSQAKLPYFEGIFQLWMDEQQELAFLQMFISFAYQNLATLCMKRPWNGYRFSWKFWCCMRSMVTQLLDFFCEMKYECFYVSLFSNSFWTLIFVLFSKPVTKRSIFGFNFTSSWHLLKNFNLWIFTLIFFGFL